MPRRRGCAAHGGHGRVEWGRSFAFSARFAVLAVWDTIWMQIFDGCICLFSGTALGSRTGAHKRGFSAKFK